MGTVACARRISRCIKGKFIEGSRIREIFVGIEERVWRRE